MHVWESAVHARKVHTAAQCARGLLAVRAREIHTAAQCACGLLAVRARNPHGRPMRVRTVGCARAKIHTAATVILFKLGDFVEIL